MPDETSKYTVESAYKDVERNALARTQAQKQPKAVMLGGQPGSGKSVLAAGAIRELRSGGGAVLIDADRMRERNPLYKQLSREDPQHAADRTHKEAGEWATRLTIVAAENRRNLVIDGTMRSPESIRDLTRRLKDAGYKIEARVMAVNAETSLARARLRFEEQVAERGTGRFVNEEQHDNAYTGIVESVRALEYEKLVDAVRVYDADQRPIYENLQGRGDWQKAPEAVQVLEQERARDWTYDERCDYVSVLEQINALASQRGSYRDNVADTLRMVADGKAMGGNENPPSRTYAQVSRPEQDRTWRTVPTDRDELAAKLEAARADLARFERSETYQRAQAFDQLTKREALAKHPELDGAYKQLHDIKQGRVAQVSQNDLETFYLNARAQLSEQLHRGQVPKGNVTLDESRRVIDMAAGQRGLIVRDAGQIKQDFKGQVVATSLHHALVQVSDMVAVRYEKAHLEREVCADEKVAIQYDSKKSQVYEQGKEPAREHARDMDR
ncbi:zeta toxin family protein [Mycetohabitans rhizoxinica]|uniref:Zeta toxin family protein n=1 Tax=Mycetohabitans rhizoxinica TaxID=412963 RepID=A0ABZ2Q0I7_9BURK